MPTTYTHDLFGKLVYRKLPGEMKELIKENGDLYRIGLHGPDIFFYQLLKGRVNQFGVQMHNERAKAFFEQGMAQIREKENRPLLAYLLGFGCHYLLDSTCHPYVNQMVKEKIINHTLLEKEWDRQLLIANGYHALMAHPADCLVPEKEYAAVIQQVFPLLSVNDIYESVRMQKFLLNLMVYGKNGMTGKVVKAVCNMSKKEDVRELADHFMRKNAVYESKEPIHKLNELFDKALEEAPAELERLYALSFMDMELSSRWNLTYNG